ncbi:MULTISPECIES: AtzH-like domain-containing protein [Uliginosibacterium]|uniref:DUF3225 domain-containing protein n=1 Tax=Uliginosibacterium aquaticum TaxID=2731212 RepID=A0ABX2IKS6_9RHOO|nr:MULTISPECIES: AtzH-like domain-containing protein [Uliginosibacterium]MDO6387438.1 DUF3225 domain-containing protein [Uliginosibacterium sp. 31-12]NSL56488.1 DUF3225 domain-containing protein [Uliginosibacterium aquaticum]PLK47064.1 DUF3225 domain-containing protein [Uliginosibacterium sp. TH139]
MPINDERMCAEVSKASDRYEAALLVNDLAVLDELFWKDGRVERVNASDEQVGIDTIRAFRAARPLRGLARERLARRIVCFGTHSATVNIVFRRSVDGRIGRQSQTWVRFGTDWRIVFAHISYRE